MAKVKVEYLLTKDGQRGPGECVLNYAESIVADNEVLLAEVKQELAKIHGKGNVSEITSRSKRKKY